MRRMPSIADTPNNEMNPMAAEILKFKLAAYSPRIPPETAHRSEQAVQKHQDQEQAHRHDDSQPLLRLHQCAELACPFHPVALGHGKFLGDAVLGLGDCRPKVASSDAVFQRDKSLIVFPVYVRGAGLELHLAEVAQRNVSDGR